MRILNRYTAIFLAIAAQALAQPTASIGARTNLALRVDVNSPTNMTTVRVYYDEKSGGSCPAATALTHALTLRPNVADVWNFNTVTALKSNTTYCAAALVNGTTWTNVVEGTTLADPPGFPTPPTPPNESWLPAEVPAINGNTYTVTANCSNLQTLLNTAAALTNALNHLIVIPANADCTGNWSLPNRAGTGWIVIRSNTPDSQLPPWGVRATPQWASKMPVLRLNNYSSEPNSSLITMGPSAKKYYLLGIQFTIGNRCSDCFTVTDATNTSPIVVATAAAHSRQTGSKVCIDKVLGNTAANGCFQITMVDATHFSLDGTTGNGAYASGGVGATNPIPYTYLILPTITSSDWIIDRCLVYGKEFPYRVNYAISFRGPRVAVMNSSIYSIQSWQGVTNTGGFGTFWQPTAIFMGPGPFAAINNYIDSHGIIAYAEQSVQPIDEMYDGVWRRNHFHLQNFRRLYDSYPSKRNPLSDGKYYAHRQSLEFKWGARVVVEGNLFDGSWTTIAAPGQQLNIPAAGNAFPPGFALTDYRIANNSFFNTVGGFQTLCIVNGGATTGTGGSKVDVLPGSRYHIVNNLFYGYRRYVEWGSNATYAQGQGISIIHGCADFLIEHNTIFDNRGNLPTAIKIGGRRMARDVIRNNLFAFNHGGLFTDDLTNPVTPPYPVGSWSAAQAMNMWQGVMRRGNAPDPQARFEYNFFIPGSKDTNNPASYDSTSTALNLNKFTVCDPNSGVLKDFLQFGNRCAGANNANNGSETANQRYAWVKFRRATPEMANNLDPGLNLRLRDDSPWKNKASDGRDPGADIDELESVQGKVKEARAREVTSNSATISYTAPDSQACTVEYGTSSDFGSGSRAADGGGHRARNVPLSGLTPNTAYTARVLCAVEQPVVTFQTQP